jgi:DNA modification methylase
LYSATGVAALKHGKAFTGIEFSEYYYRVAIDRLKNGRFDL